MVYVCDMKVMSSDFHIFSLFFSSIIERRYKRVSKYRAGFGKNTMVYARDMKVMIANFYIVYSLFFSSIIERRYRRVFKY